MKQIRTLALATALLQPATTALLAQGSPRICGVERWPVKIATDAYASRIDTSVVRATVAELAALPRPSTPLEQRRRISPLELRTFHVIAVIREVRSEDDGDLHVVLQDLEEGTQTLVAEVPDSACALGSTYIHAFASAYRAVRAAPPNAIVALDGVGFFDYLHGQVGMAPNGFELHPIVRVRVLGRYGASGVPDTTVSRRARGATEQGSATKVWVNTRSRVYHCPGSRYYGATSSGTYMTEQEAIASGARPAYGRRC
ncbi:MAG TPA: hypothetical protein VFT29_02440 [Gemmatimonadaceae bacterium]|nr:hypothetical protein [Gemmatimonadaceae bacterium]